MINPNPYFYACLELITNMGFPVAACSPGIKFLKNDSLVFRAYFKRVGVHAPMPLSGITIDMTIGSETIVGTAIDNTNGIYDFTVPAAVTSGLTAGLQDVSFILTKTATSEQTYIRIENAIQPVGIT